MRTRTIALVLCLVLVVSAFSFLVGSMRTVNASADFLAVSISPTGVKLGVGQTQVFVATVSNRDASYLPYFYSWTDGGGQVLGTGQTLSFSFKEPCNGTVLSVTVISLSRGNQGYASIWVADPYTSASLYLDALQTGWVVQADGLGWYGAFYNGKLMSSSTSASVGINYVITATPSGARIHLSTGTFTGTTEILFNKGGASGALDGLRPSRQWILEGDGAATRYVQNTASTNAITIRNGTSVIIRDMYITMGSGAGYGILSDNKGSHSEEGFVCSSLYNVHLEGGNPSYGLLRLINPFYSSIDNVYAISGTSGVVPVRIESNSTSILYGNTKIGFLYAFATGADGVIVQCLNTDDWTPNIDMLTFEILQISGASTTGHAGLVIGNKVEYSNFNFIDSELFETAVLINTTSGNSNGLAPRYCNILGGFMSGTSYGIRIGIRGWNMFVQSVTVAGGTKAYYDTSYQPSQYANLYNMSGAITGGTKVWP